MNSKTEQLLAEFKTIHEGLYGENFLLETQDSSDFTKIVVMTEKLGEELRQLIKDDTSVRVVSLDKDVSTGNYYKVVSPAADLYHYYRDPKEWHRMMDDLDSSMVTMSKDSSGSLALASELVEGEVFRGVETKSRPGWVAVAVCHDFEDIAPKQMGWIQLTDSIKTIDERKLERPAKLRTLEEVIAEYSGVPYHLSGKSKKRGFDCSGLTQRTVYETQGVWLPRIAKWQALVGKTRGPNKEEKGDLVICEESPHWFVEHIGIFLEKSSSLPIMFQSSRHTQGVTIANLNNESWFKEKFKIGGYITI